MRGFVALAAAEDRWRGLLGRFDAFESRAAHFSRAEPLEAITLGEVYEE